MEDIDDCFSGTRREFVTATGAGAVAVLAGCSGDDDTISNLSTDQNSDSDSAETDYQNSGSTYQGTGTVEDSDESGYEDTSTHNDEQDMENVLDGASYNWFEVDESNQQFSLPEEEISINADGYDAVIRALNYISYREETPSNEFTEDVEAVYVAFRKESSETYRLQLIPVSEKREAYESGSYSNNQVMSLGEQDVDVLTRFLDETVLGASDVSDDMPQEYLDLVG